MRSFWIIWGRGRVLNPMTRVLRREEEVAICRQRHR